MTTEYGQTREGQYGRPAPYGQAPYGQMRASDQDRERVTGLLQAAYAQGRLDQQEYDERLGLALTAQVHAQLDAVVADLVPPPARLMSRGTNSLAIASLACGAGQVLVGPLSAIPAVVLGHMARRQISETGEEGAGLALAGLVLGYIGVAMIVLFIGVLAVIIGIAAHL
jgi:hypothetical protein